MLLVPSTFSGVTEKRFNKKSLVFSRAYKLFNFELLETRRFAALVSIEDS